MYPSVFSVCLYCLTCSVLTRCCTAALSVYKVSLSFYYLCVGVAASQDQDFGTANLHVEVSDVVSVLVYVGVAKGNGVLSKTGKAHSHLMLVETGAQIHSLELPRLWRSFPPLLFSQLML